MTQEEIAVSMAFKNCFSGESGQKVLKVLDDKCLYRGNLFNADSDRVTSFNCGKNAVIRYIHQEIDRDLSIEAQAKAIHETTQI